MPEDSEECNEKYIKWILEESKPLDIQEWEGMVVDAEIPSVGMVTNEKDAIKLAQSVLRLSSEVRRLRYKCGEEVWNSVWQTEKNCEEEKQAYLERDRQLFAEKS